jgi:phage tail-like protein
MKSTDIAHLLPSIFQRIPGAQPDVLGAFLVVMEQLHAPSENVLAELDRYFLPDRTDDDYLFFLARWVDLDWLVVEDGLPGANGQSFGRPKSLVRLSRLRRLIYEAVSLHRQRGTRAALVRFLQIATGVQGFNVWEDPHRPFHIRVECPWNEQLDLSLVRRIVEFERPAFVTFELCRRGTLENLPQFLEIDTSVQGFRIEQQKGPDQSIHLVVGYPSSADSEQVKKTIDQVVRYTLPGKLTYAINELHQNAQEPSGAEGGS